jgi:hypothetical protein
MDEKKLFNIALQRFLKAFYILRNALLFPHIATLCMNTVDGDSPRPFDPPQTRCVSRLSVRVPRALSLAHHRNITACVSKDMKPYNAQDHNHLAPRYSGTLDSKKAHSAKRLIVLCANCQANLDVLVGRFNNAFTMRHYFNRRSTLKRQAEDTLSGGDYEV